jgi:hypothetical protein
MMLRSMSTPRHPDAARAATIDELLERIQSGDASAIVDAAREIARRGDTTACPSLRQILTTTESTEVRNAVALALSDVKDPLMMDLLIELVKDPRTAGNRGTLLYALGAYDCASILPLLVSFVVEGNFEVSRQALSIISTIAAVLDEATWRTCSERVREGLRTATEERRPLLEELLALFDQE